MPPPTPSNKTTVTHIPKPVDVDLFTASGACAYYAAVAFSITVGIFFGILFCMTLTGQALHHIVNPPQQRPAQVFPVPPAGQRPPQRR